ncbi:hypothetical protein C8F04DRAFT_290423 [Mycena alexandri]|uniref:Uncharacterized protein n=1 Tax=Mycena alexandri TaxID=1745969 RepID=A0AAD6WTR2_9AGAR|nr:hypothetical protein C8F04DRAFT_290423 [Mycena alexandri]
MRLVIRVIRLCFYGDGASWCGARMTGVVRSAMLRCGDPPPQSGCNAAGALPPRRGVWCTVSSLAPMEAGARILHSASESVGVPSAAGVQLFANLEMDGWMDADGGGTSCLSLFFSRCVSFGHVLARGGGEGERRIRSTGGGARRARACLPPRRAVRSGVDLVEAYRRCGRTEEGRESSARCEAERGRVSKWKAEMIVAGVRVELSRSAKEDWVRDARCGGPLRPVDGRPVYESCARCGTER